MTGDYPKIISSPVIGSPVKKYQATLKAGNRQENHLVFLFAKYDQKAHFRTLKRIKKSFSYPTLYLLSNGSKAKRQKQCKQSCVFFCVDINIEIVYEFITATFNFTDNKTSKIELNIKTINNK